ncbi:MAG: type II toxin-antitoxin system VapC family toxin [Janthinobacterium lividum]
MTRVVVDASITAAILLDDEVTERDGPIWDALRDGDLFIPAYWSIEMVSLLLNAQRRNRMTLQRRNEHFDSAKALLARAEIDKSGMSKKVMELATAAGLTAYDAGYLEMAARLGASLATNDVALIKAGPLHGVPILTTRP